MRNPRGKPKSPQGGIALEKEKAIHDIAQDTGSIDDFLYLKAQAGVIEQLLAGGTERILEDA